jgi:hypothetical protein
VSTALDGQVTISLPKGTLLILLEFLYHSYDVWNDSKNQSPSHEGFVLLQPDAGERTALWQLEGAIEKTLPEVFASDYKDLIGAWKQRLISDEK